MQENTELRKQSNLPPVNFEANEYSNVYLNSDHREWKMSYHLPHWTEGQTTSEILSFQITVVLSCNKTSRGIIFIANKWEYNFQKYSFSANKKIYLK